MRWRLLGFDENKKVVAINCLRFVLNISAIRSMRGSAQPWPGSPAPEPYVRSGTVRSRPARSGTVRYGLVRSGPVRYGPARAKPEGAEGPSISRNLQQY